jgi:hypothetical protein
MNILPCFFQSVTTADFVPSSSPAETAFRSKNSLSASPCFSKFVRFPRNQLGGKLTMVFSVNKNLRFS